MGLHLFISRAGEDREIARWIAGVLREAGHEARLQDDFGTGSFPDHIGRALKWADRLIAVLSPHYVEKPYTRAELDAAYARDPAGFIIPIRVEPCIIPDQIRQLSTSLARATNNGSGNFWTRRALRISLRRFAHRFRSCPRSTLTSSAVMRSWTG